MALPRGQFSTHTHYEFQINANNCQSLISPHIRKKKHKQNITDLYSIITRRHRSHRHDIIVQSFLSSVCQSIYASTSDFLILTFHSLLFSIPSKPLSDTQEQALEVSHNSTNVPPYINPTKSIIATTMTLVISHETHHPRAATPAAIYPLGDRNPYNKQNQAKTLTRTQQAAGQTIVCMYIFPSPDQNASTNEWASSREQNKIKQVKHVANSPPQLAANTHCIFYWCKLLPNKISMRLYSYVILSHTLHLSTKQWGYGRMPALWCV